MAKNKKTKKPTVHKLMQALKEGVFFHHGPISHTTSQKIYGRFISEEIKIPHIFTAYLFCNNAEVQHDIL